MASPYRDTATITRTYWYCDLTVMKDDDRYEEGAEERYQTTKDNASLIASLTENGLHAPALDIDWEVSHLTDGRRHRLLVLVGTEERPCQPIDGAAWMEVLRASLEAGLITRDTFDDEYPFFADCMGTLFWPELRFDVPMTIVPSTTPGHHHLYLEHEMPWEHYRRFLRALGAVDILEQGYVAAAERREMTMLVKPGMKNPKKRPGVLSRLFSGRSSEQ